MFSLEKFFSLSNRYRRFRLCDSARSAKLLGCRPEDNRIASTLSVSLASFDPEEFSLESSPLLPDRINTNARVGAGEIGTYGKRCIGEDKRARLSLRKLHSPHQSLSWLARLPGFSSDRPGDCGIFQYTYSPRRISYSPGYCFT